MTQSFAHELRVRFAECDPQGVVFNANYLVYFDVAFTELWRAAIGPWSLTSERGVALVLAEINTRFLAPARYDEIVELHATIVKLGNTSLTTHIDVVRDATRLVAGQLRHVCIDLSTWKKTAIPDWAREGLRPYTRDLNASDAG